MPDASPTVLLRSELRDAKEQVVLMGRAHREKRLVGDFVGAEVSALFHLGECLRWLDKIAEGG